MNIASVGTSHSRELANSLTALKNTSCIPRNLRKTKCYDDKISWVDMQYPSDFQSKYYGSKQTLKPENVDILIATFGQWPLAGWTRWFADKKPMTLREYANETRTFMGYLSAKIPMCSQTPQTL